ncbi:MAG: tetratricopeptide repeat protein [Vicinamibacterales bacterium]
MSHEPLSGKIPAMRSSLRSLVRFGAYELDSRAGELRKHGLRVRLQNKPLRILELLLEHPGQVMTREELRTQLWPEHVFVDFDHGLNSAVNKLRDALCDSAVDPKFIETTLRGYRFIAEVEPIEAPAPAPLPAPAPPAPIATPASVDRPAFWRTPAQAAALAAAMIALAVVGSFLTLRLGAKPSSSQLAVAVLPFQNLSSDPQQEFFSEGFTDELTAQLGRLAPAQLRVIAPASTMNYKRTQKPAEQVGRELGVDYILQGTVDRVGSRVHISSQLVRMRDQAHLWSRRYERDVRDLVALQAEVARAIADQIEITIEQSTRRTFAARPGIDPDVYEAYLKGRYFVDRGKTLSAVEHFERAIARDPTYAAAYAGLADAWGQIGWALSAEKAPEQAYRNALRAAEQALRLDEGLAPAHVALGRIRWKYEWDWDAAETSITRAIELDPNSAVAHESYFDLLSAMGRHRDAYVRLKQAAALDPVSLTITYDFGLHFARTGDHDRAVEWLQKAIELDPASGFVHHLLGEAYAEHGHLAQAVASLQRAIELSGSNPHFVAILASIQSQAGDRLATARALGSLETQARHGYVSPYNLAMIHSSTGNGAEAIAFLDRAYEQRDPWLSLIRVQPQFNALAGNAKFQDLLRRLGLHDRPVTTH